SASNRAHPVPAFGAGCPTTPVYPTGSLPAGSDAIDPIDTRRGRPCRPGGEARGGTAGPLRIRTGRSSTAEHSIRSGGELLGLPDQLEELAAIARGVPADRRPGQLEHSRVGQAPLVRRPSEEHPEPGYGAGELEVVGRP